MHKRIRLACLGLVVAGLMASPSAVQAAVECCNRGWDECNLVVCANHGGAAFCFIHVGGGCSNLCQCMDGYFTADFVSGCPPCAGG